MSHVPVLLHEVLQYLDPKPGEFIIDGTVDGGGHAEKIIEEIAPGGMLLGIDWDGEILSRTENDLKKKADEQRVSTAFVRDNYARTEDILREKKLPKTDGLLLDLGFSSEQLEESGRGFSFMKNEPLLMTYSDDEISVRQILKELTERDLAKIIFAYSGEKFAMKIARAIKAQGKLKPIETTEELRKVIESVVPKNYERGRINPATRTFQALRIYANHELENIESILKKVPQILKPNGRIVVISFHSLEDRIVKHTFRDMAKSGLVEILTKKPIEASEEELSQNPRSRSAKLRAIKLSSNLNI